ncbi:DHBP synthase RibB-like alpha/beta domain-containing protein, partial [Coemansia spiralis]
LRANNCVAMPTETVYGLAANALDPRAVQSIYQAKQRPSDNPLIVHVSSIRMLRALYHIPRVYHEVIRRFWPGPLTIVLPRPRCIPMEVLGGHGSTVAFRFPSHPVARAIIAASGLPVAAPSANASGRPSPTLAQHVLNDLDGRLPLIIDSGPCDVGVESTVLDAYSDAAVVSGALSPCILRPGGVTLEELQALGGVWANIRVYRRDFSSAEMEMHPTTPGMKYRHYSPTAPVYVVQASGEESTSAQERLQGLVAQLRAANKKVGAVVVGSDGAGLGASGAIVHRVGDAKALAHGIFACLRALDEARVDAIVVQGVSETNEGMAVMNRINKAASHHV